MAKKNGGERSERLVGDFERSGLRRREYCEREGIAITTLDYHVRRRRMVRAAVKLTPVTVTTGPATMAAMTGAQGGFTLVLSNGRRIETGWDFSENQLARLIRVAGAA
jgi:hypothetical protein